MAACCSEDEDINREALEVAISELLGEHQFDNDLRELLVNFVCVTVGMLSVNTPDADERLQLLFFHHQGLPNDPS